jgi:glyoxylase-like metal-dependent hydrolase (beta-lactamase superfamily II)
VLLLSVVSLAGSSAELRAQTNAGSTVEALRVSDGPIYVFFGAGGNVTASVGPDGVLLVDSGTAAKSPEFLAALQRLQAQIGARVERPDVRWGAEGQLSILDYRNTPAVPKPVRFIINTSDHPDHTGGNLTISTKYGKTYSGGNVAGTIADSEVGAAVYARETVQLRMSKAGQPFRMLPTETYYTPSMKLSQFFNGDGVRLIHMPAAYSDGDTIVHFTHSDVIATGKIFSQTRYPEIDLKKGGSVNGVIDALNYILELAIPEFRTEGGTMIIPGDGRISDSADVGYYRDMVTIVRDHIQEMIKRGMSLEQVKAARPTKPYDARFGATTGPWTTDMFVEAVYRSLMPLPKPTTDATGRPATTEARR